MILLNRPLLGGEEAEAVSSVLSTGQVAAGPRVRAFEEEFASYIGTRHAVATSSGTAALHVALLSAGIGPGDKVITTPFTFAATANAVLFCGATPVFVDIDRTTLNLSTRAVARAVQGPKVKALLVVHLYGLPCDMEEIVATVKDRKILLIEDCAQAHGAEYRGRKVGTFGHVSIFSFYATKNMTTGEGGMLVTDDPWIARKARAIINHGAYRKYRHEMLGYNYRMTDIAAALGLVQLRKLPGFNQARRRNAAYLSARFNCLRWLEVPPLPTDRVPVFHQYTVRVKNREKFCAHLAANGVGYGIYYPLPLHRQPLYRQLGYGGVSLQESERAAREVVSLPVHPGLASQDLTKIAEVVASYREHP